MKALVVGYGLIGAALAAQLRDRAYEVTTTRKRALSGHICLDLEHPPADIPLDGKAIYDIAFLCAGIKDPAHCEGPGPAWRVNVDGVVAIADLLAAKGTRLVYISSTTVEWSPCARARQHAQVEAMIHAYRPLIIRAGPVTEESVADLCEKIMGHVEAHRRGVVHWRWAPPEPHRYGHAYHTGWKY